MISCEQHDYVEIACTFRYPLKLSLRSGETISCTATDTKLNESRVECIQVDIDGKPQLLPLSDIANMEVTIDNPHFKSISFA